MFDMLKKVKGTPKYWQTVKNELVAKVKQLGPFHIFYTFSCGEMRWSEVFVSLLKRKGFKVEILEDWDGNDATLLVEGKNSGTISIMTCLIVRMSSLKTICFL